MNPLQENLKVWNELCNYFRNLSEEQVEMFIKYGKENTSNFGNEDNWREAITKIKNEI